MKTYHVTLRCDVLAKSDTKALDLLNKAVLEAMKIGLAGVSITAEEVTDE